MKLALLSLPTAAARRSMSDLQPVMLRGLQQKSNDVASIIVELLPFHIVLFVNTTSLTVSGTGSDDMFLDSDDTLELVEETLTTLAVETLNVTYAGRLQDVEFDLTVLSDATVASLSQQRAVDTLQEITVVASDTSNFLIIEVQGNTTFFGSYYLDDPEPDDVTSTLLGDLDGVLLESLNWDICQQLEGCLDRDQLELIGSIQLDEIKMETSEILDSEVATGNDIKVDEAAADDNLFAPNAANEQVGHNANQSIKSSESRNASNAAAWAVPTALILSIIVMISLYVYRRKQKTRMQKEIRRINTLEVTPASSSSSILKREAGKIDKPSNNSTGNDAKTTFNKQSIDQLLQNFANDDMSLVSDPSTNDASEYSGFSNFSELDLQNHDAKLDLREAALTSSKLHNPQTDKITKNNTTYLPLTLQKQESFEGQYRTISAMASVLRKDILHVAGETGGGGRTMSPSKSLERQKMRDGGLMGGTTGGDGKYSISEVRVGIRPAAKEDMEKGENSKM